MKIQSHSLIRFIEDFKLEREDTTICFEETILYTTLTKQIQLPSEVHIIHLQHTGLDLIYLLHPDIVKQGIPDKIEDATSILYRPEKFLYIKGRSIDDGNYLLGIPVAGNLY